MKLFEQYNIVDDMGRVKQVIKREADADKYYIGESLLRDPAIESVTKVYRLTVPQAREAGLI